MFNVIKAIIGIAFTLIVLYFAFLFIAYDVAEARRYKRANRAAGRIVEVLDIEKVASYGRTQRRRYRKYMVRFSTNEGEFTEALLLRKRKLQVGDSVEVHYDVDEEGMHVLNDISVRRLTELVISVMIAIPLCIFIMYVEGNK